MKNFFIICIFLLISNNYLTQNTNDISVDLLIEYLEVKYPDEIFSDFIYIGIKRQKLLLVKDRKLLKYYSISSAKLGVGNIKDSDKTPLGLHKIYKLYGDNVPLGGIFKTKIYTGNIAVIEKDTIVTNLDIMSSRIITMKGLENGLNRGKNIDSYNRNIYIHGTNEEGLIGTAVSHGCIRMNNIDIIDLYSKVKKNMLIVILNN